VASAKIAESILPGGRQSEDLSVFSVDQFAYVVNMTTARKLSLFPSVGILQTAETVEQIDLEVH
jgi:hypothetical protein